MYVLMGSSERIEALWRPQDLRSQKAKDRYRQSYRTVHIDGMSCSFESADLAGSRLQCASAAIADESIQIVSAAFPSSLASG